MPLVAYKVRIVHADGTVTLTPRIAFRSIAASSAVTYRRLPGIGEATVVQTIGGAA